jgi:hypothetical protein
MEEEVVAEVKEGVVIITREEPVRVTDTLLPSLATSTLTALRLIRGSSAWRLPSVMGRGRRAGAKSSTRRKESNKGISKGYVKLHIRAIIIISFTFSEHIAHFY